MMDADMPGDLRDAYRPPPPRAPWQDFAEASARAAAREDEDGDSDGDTAPAAVSAPAVPDGHEAAEFLARWAQDWRPEWLVNLTAIPANGGPTTGQSWPAGEVAASKAEIAAWAAERNARGYNIYFTPNPLRRAVSTKPKKDDIAAPWVLSVDLDPPEDARPYAERRKAVLAAAKALSEDTEAPACIVDSGNGIGAFFRVQDASETPIVDAEAACKTLTRVRADRFGLKADGTHNADRLMRLPGTLNWPSPRKRAAGYPAVPSEARVLFEPPGAVPLSSARVAALAGQDRTAQARTPKSKGSTPATTKAAGAGGTTQDTAAVLAAAWPDIAALGSVDDLPTELRARLDAAVLPRDGFGKRWAGVTEGLTDPSGSGLLMALVACAKAAGFDLLDTARIAWVWQGTDGARHLHEQGDPVRTLARCWGNSIASPDSLPAEVEAITAEGWFVVQVGASVLVARRQADGGLTLLPRQAFLTLMENRRVATPKGSKPAAMVWLAHKARPTWGGAGLYPPGADCPADHLNLWTAWGVEPGGGRAGCRRILRHLLDVICQGDRDHWKWLLRWMAWGVQNAAEKQDVAVALVGGQGTGKGAVASVLRRIYGRASIQITSKDHLTGRFNGHLADKMFVFADEALFARDPTIVGTLKALVTERTMTVERKGVDAVQAPNRFRLLMASNEDHAVHVEADDRRFAVFQTAGKRGRAYFDALFREINGDGTAAFFAMLRGMNLKGWDMRALPATQARVEQKLASLPALASWWGGVLTDGDDGGAGFGGPADWFGGQPTRVPKADIYDHYADAMRRKGERRVLDARQFWAGLRKMVALQEIRPAGNGGRVVVLPTLADARDQFTKQHGLGNQMEWDE